MRIESDEVIYENGRAMRLYIYGFGRGLGSIFGLSGWGEEEVLHKNRSTPSSILSHMASYV